MNRRALQRLFRRISQGHHQNVAFNDFVELIEAFGFGYEGSRGSHKSYFRQPQCLLVLQPDRGQAKAYQVRQFLRMVERYQLRMEE